MLSYDVTNWYWYVGGNQTQVFSSKIGDYVSPTNADFLAWVSAGGVPTNIDTEANLGDVLAVGQARPVNANVFDGYADSQSRAITIQVIAKVLLWCVNQIRTMQSQSTFNAAQFRAFIKSIM